jgi:hypothetical protein
LTSVCLVPGLDFSEIPVSISAVSAGYQLIYFLDFRLRNGQFLTHSSNPLKYCKYVFFNIHYSNIATADFLVISAETTCWEIERK